MSNKQKLVDFSELSDMLYGEEKYIREFAQAAISSFSEFSTNYEKYLLERDEANFRKAGHKIKPVVQMLKIEQVVNEYEHAKTLLWDEKPEEDLQESANKIRNICSNLITELEKEI